MSKDGVILAGNNEDWTDPLPKMWFYPADEGKHGWVKFAWRNGFPQGGMNDQGLFWDGTAGPYMDMPWSVAHKTLLNPPIMQKVIEECATIEEAREVFAKYYHNDLFRAQYLIGDSSGNSMIVEGDAIREREGSFQVLTNFIQSHPELGGYPCWRYETAVGRLSQCGTLTPYYVGMILDETHQEGNYPTQYSNIYDLKNGIFYLFYYHYYFEYLVVDLQKELGNGPKVYDIPLLFSRTKMLYPADSALLSEVSVTLTWQGLSDSNYEVVYAKNADLSDPTTLQVHRTDPQKAGMASAFSVVCLITAACIALVLRKKKTAVIPMFLSLFLLSNTCKKEAAEELHRSIEFSENLENLEPNTQYFWKVKAHTDYGGHFVTETLVRSFTTSGP